MQKLLVILGPTASGKSALAVELAQKFNGEIISADSRQVYKGLDIGTNKITEEEMKGVPHHLLDVTDPKEADSETFSVDQYKKLAQAAILDISSRGKLAILCGGTGFYISAVIDNVSLPAVAANPELRDKLSKETVEILFNRLQELDPDRALTIDPHNKVRLIRALEIAQTLGKVPHLGSKDPSEYNTLQIGLVVDDTLLKERITARTQERIQKGMIEEAERLYTSGLSYERMHQLGLEYRALADFLQNKINKEELINRINTETWHYVKRQRTWFKKDPRIKWFSLDEKEKIINEIKTWI